MNAASNTAVKCGKCAFCVAGCPVFSATMRQALGPRSKAFILDRIRSGEARISPELAQAFYLCTHCGQCAAICPSKVPVADLVMEGRILAAQQNAAPGPLKRAVRSLGLDGNPFGQSREKRTELTPAGAPRLQKGGALFWAGCLAAYQDLKIIPSAFKAFGALEETVFTLGDREGCCGYLAWLSGDEDAFLKIARQNQNLLSKADRIVTTCAGCHTTFDHLYPAYGVDIPKTIHFTTWLAEKSTNRPVPFTDGPKPLGAIYHDPCDLGRHGGIYDAPRKIIQALPGVTLLEFDANRDQAQCCGGGGGLKASALDLSLAMAENRVRQALDKNPDVIVSSCPSCKQNLNQAAARLKRKNAIPKKIKVMDITELIASRLR